MVINRGGLTPLGAPRHALVRGPPPPGGPKARSGGGAPFLEEVTGNALVWEPPSSGRVGEGRGPKSNKKEINLCISPRGTSTST